MSTDNDVTKFTPAPFIPAIRSEVACFASDKGIQAELETALCHTREIFGSDARVDLEEDAEIPGDLCLVFNVKTTGEVDEVLRREDEWHERNVMRVPGATPFLRLNVDIV